MLQGRVVGEIWGSHKHPYLEGWTMLLVQPRGIYELGPGDDSLLVVLDRLGAGTGDEVIVSLGQAARVDAHQMNLPAEAAVVAIVDGWTDQPDPGDQP